MKLRIRNTFTMSSCVYATHAQCIAAYTQRRRCVYPTYETYTQRRHCVDAKTHEQWERMGSVDAVSTQHTSNVQLRIRSVYATHVRCIAAYTQRLRCAYAAYEHCNIAYPARIRNIRSVYAHTQRLRNVSLHIRSVYAAYTQHMSDA